MAGEEGVSNFDTIITNEIKKKIAKKVNKDYRELRDAFWEFIHKYGIGGTVGDFKKTKEYTLQSLSIENNHEFIMFPELEEFLFKQECTKLIDSIMAEAENLKLEPIDEAPTDEAWVSWPES